MANLKLGVPKPQAAARYWVAACLELGHAGGGKVHAVAVLRLPAKLPSRNQGPFSITKLSPPPWPGHQARKVVDGYFKQILIGTFPQDS